MIQSMLFRLICVHNGLVVLIHGRMVYSMVMLHRLVHLVIMRNNALLAYPAVNKALTPGYLESSSFSALSYNQLNSQSVNIAASMTGQAMPAMLAPEQSDVFTNAEKALLVEKGMGYFQCQPCK